MDRPPHRSPLAILLLAGTVSVGCSDDPTGPGDPLTEAERTLLVQSLFSLGFDAAAAEPPAAAGPAASGPAAAEIDFTLDDVTVPCPIAGTVSVSVSLTGTVDEATGDADVDYTLDQIHNGCVVRSDDESVQIRIDGEPGSTLTFAIASSGGAFTADGTLVGTVRYTAGDRTGVCTTDVAWSGSGQFDGSGSFTLSGTVCGADVSTSFTGP